MSTIGWAGEGVGVTGVDFDEIVNKGVFEVKFKVCPRINLPVQKHHEGRKRQTVFRDVFAPS